jgi:uncharacterized protein with HEPN domain
MPRDYKLLLEDILAACRKIQQYAGGLDEQALRQDERTYDAVLRNLEVIGEAVKGLPESVRRRRPEIAWKKIAGMRDVLVHEYFGVTSRVVWDVVVHHLGPLVSAAEALLEENMN